MYELQISGKRDITTDLTEIKNNKNSMSINPTMCIKQTNSLKSLKKKKKHQKPIWPISVKKIELML